MEETVKTLVEELQKVVKEQTKNKYPDVNDALTSLLKYIQMTANKSGVESRLKKLEDILSNKSEKKKPCTDHIQKIRNAMFVATVKASASSTKQEERVDFMNWWHKEDYVPRKLLFSRNPTSPTPSGKSKSSQIRANLTKMFGSAPGRKVKRLQGQKIDVQPLRNSTSLPPNEKSTQSQSQVNLTKMFSNPASPAPGGEAKLLQGQIINVQPIGPEGTQTDEAKKLSGTIDQNEEECQDEMADEVRFFEECLNGLRKMYSDDTKSHPEKIIPTPKGKSKKKFKTGHKYIMDVAVEIRRLQSENQYLRTALDGIYKHVICGEETTLKELKTPKSMKDNQSILEVEANIKEATQKFHEIETDAENAVKERDCLLSTLERLFNHVRGLSEGEIEGDISTALDEIRLSFKKETSANQVLTHVKEISNIQAEWKREAEYTAHLLAALNDHSTYDGNQDNQVRLKEPPFQTTSASNKDKRKGHKKLKDDPPSSRHVEQLHKNFANASDVLRKQMNAEEAIAERKCLLLTLESLFNHVRDQSECKTEGDILSVLDEIRSSIKKESSANQGVTHAKEILSIQMEWKSETEYASHLLEELSKISTSDGKQDTQVSLKEPPIQMANDSNRSGKNDNKKQNDVSPRSRHIERLQRNYTSASNVLKKHIDAEQATKEREYLLATLNCLFNHVQDLSDGKTESDISLALDQIRSSIKKESTANQGLSHAREISIKQMEWKRDAENAIKERECLLQTLECLFNHVRDLSQNKKEGDISFTLHEIWSSVKNDSRANQGLSHAKEISSYQMEWKREVEYVVCLLKELTEFSDSTSNGDKSIVLSHPQNLETLVDFKTKETSRNNLMQSLLNQKLMKHYTNASHVLKQMKENENLPDTLRMDLRKKTEQVEDMRKRLQNMQDDNNRMKKDAESLRTRLSEQAGALLTFENPSIADLSDPNRPTKVSEKYSELYDNEWTDACGILSKKYVNISEDKIIGYLYDMLVDGYHFCKDVREAQKRGLEDILFDPAGGMKSNQRTQRQEVSKIFAKNLSDVAKQSSNVASANMAKAFVMDKKTKDKYRETIKLCETYIQESVQLCWFMLVQTPPLFLDLKSAQGQAFDKNFYREYTKKGKNIAFVVWPALFLHENGPMLCKGVAQGQ